MFVFAADLHLAQGAWVSMPQVKHDSYASWHQIVDYCVCNKSTCKGLVLGGDVFDTHPPAETVATFIRGVDTLTKAGVAVYAIQGQHGWSKFPWPSIHPAVHDLNMKTVELGNLVLYGLDHLPPQELQEALESVPKRANVLVLRQMVRGCVPDIEGRQNWDFDPAWLPDQVKLTLLGDFHQPWHRTVQLRSGASEMYYSGSTQMHSVDEPAEKSFLVVDDDIKVTRQPLRTRPFRAYVVTSEETLAETVQAVGELEPDTLVLVRCDTSVRNVLPELKKANDAVHYMLRLVALSAGDDGAMVQVDLEKLQEISLGSC